VTEWRAGAGLRPRGRGFELRIPPVGRGGCCVPTPTQRAIPPGSANEYQRKRAGHTTPCTGPVSVVLRLLLVSGWGLRKRRSAPPHGP